MKAKDYLITWLWTSILMYFLYDVVWVLADHEEFNRLLEEGCTTVSYTHLTLPTSDLV